MEQVAFFEQPTVSLAETSLLSPSPSDGPGSPTPSSHQDEKKQVKKRKSWGQELPTPKTNLPPRKRAKTEDEKEQRRIERVLRNRQAAQSSRERKRQEVEKLEGERDVIHHENRALKARLMAIEDEKDSMKRQLAAMREVLRKNGLQAYSPPASPIISPKMFQEQIIKEESDDLPSLFQSSPQRTLDSDVSLPSTSAPTETSDNALDLAQHPAVPAQGVISSEVPTGSSRRNSVASAATPASSLSDGSFNNLFDDGHSPVPTSSFFEEGFAVNSGDVTTDNVHFDNMVDFDTEVSTEAIDSNNFVFDGDNHFDAFPFDFNSSNDTIVDFSHQSATTSTHLQPCIGASS